MLAHSSYGKERVRLVQVLRGPDRHDLRDLTVAVRFEGEYEASYTDGDNRDVLPTDTMKNTVYALAAQRAVSASPRSFGIALARHFLERNGRLARVRIEMTEHRWGRIPKRRAPARARRSSSRVPTRGRRSSRPRGTVSTSRPALPTSLSSSRRDSAFSGFPRDEFTTLPETRDRLLATSLTATWVYGEPGGRIRLGVARRTHARCSTPSRSTTASRCSTRCTRWGRPCSTPSRTWSASTW